MEAIMSDFVEKLRLAEKAAEDIYIAKLNRELIDALHARMQAEQGADQSRVKAHAEDITVVSIKK
jgi:hypothetical protein